MAEWSSVISVWGFFVVFILQGVSGKVEIVKPFPQNVYPIEGEPTSATCIAEGPHDEVQFVRRNQFGQFRKVAESARVFTTNKTSGDRTTFTLHFTSVKLEDDSTVERYECWAHTPGDNTDQWVSSAKHGFNLQVIRKSALPTVLPNEAVLKLKEVGESLVMECNMSIPTKAFDVVPEAVHWLKDKVIIETIYAEGGKFKRTLKPLVFNSIAAKDGGNYTCILETKLKKIKPYNITGGPYVVKINPTFQGRKLTDNEKVEYQGDDTKLDCSAVGFPLTVIWEIKPRHANSWVTLQQTNISDTRYKLTESKEYMATDLEIKDIRYSDRGFYKCCIIRVNATKKCQEFVLRVRDPLGPLWPIIGIIVEAIILFFIIFFTERSRKNKQQARRADGRVEFSYTSSDEGDKSRVRFRPVGDKSSET